MTRFFDGVDDVVYTSVVSATNVGFGTFAAIVRITSFGATRSVMRFMSSSFAASLGMFADASGKVGMSNAAAAPVGVTSLAADEWYLIAVGKATGLTTPRVHIYRYSTGVWVHENTGSSIADAPLPGVGGVLAHGSQVAAQFMPGTIAATGFWASNLSDANVETLRFSSASWNTLSPAGFWLFNQASVTDNVNDQTANGGNQAGITGTTVVTEEPPGWAYSGNPITPGIVGQGAAAFTATNTATLTPALPTGWLPDDIHILIATRGDNTAMTALSGWTQLSAANNTTAIRTEVWARRAVAGDAAPTVTFGSGTVVRGAAIIGIRGVSTSVALTSLALSRSDNAASATVTIATLTPTDANTLLVALLTYEDDPTAATALSGFGAWVLSGTTLGNDVLLGYASRMWPNASTATGALTSTVSGGTFTNSPNTGILIALPPVPNTGVTGTGGVSIGVSSFSGSGTNVDPPVSGSGGVSVHAPSLSGMGALVYESSGALSIGVGVLAGTGALVYTGTGAIGIGVGALNGVGGLGYAGTGAFSISKPALSGAGVLGYVGAGGVSIGVVVLAGAGASVSNYTGAGGVGVGAPAFGGTGTLAYVGGGGVGVGVGALAGVGVLGSGGVGGVSVGAPSLLGAGVLGYVGSGGVSVGVGVLSGGGALTYVGAGGIGVGVGGLSGGGIFTGAVGGGGFFVVGPPTLSGTGALGYTSAGSVGIGHPSVSGGATYASVSAGSGGVLVGHATFEGASLLGYEGAGAVSLTVGSLNGDGYLSYAGVGGVDIDAPVFSAEGLFYIPTVTGIGNVILIGPTFGGEGAYVAAPVMGTGGISVGMGILSGVGLVVGLLPPIVGQPKAVLIDTMVRATLLDDDRTGVAVLSGNTYAQEV